MALSLVEGIGPRISRALIAHFGSASQVFRSKGRDLRKIPDMGQIRAERVVRFNEFIRVEQEFEFALKNEIAIHTYTDDSYPTRLGECTDGPLVLFTKGKGSLNASKVVAVVGTRYATDYGTKVTDAIVRGLADLDVIIVSGLAYGIDICAHRRSIEHDIPTFGVFAHGMDKIYPSRHAAVADEMLQRGGWVTEHFSGTVPERDNFPKRNRIIAGLSDAVIVVEAAQKGGALITARYANDYNRDVFAVPGNIGNIYSEGCNLLIRSHQAALYSDISDISYIMGWEIDKGGSSHGEQTRLFVADDESQQLIYDHLNAASGPVQLQSLIETTGISAEMILPALLHLQLSGVITELPGKRYRIY
jgi:DNA processing protein